MLVAACPGPSGGAPGWADARLRGVLELQQRLHQAEQNLKQMKKSNLGSGWPRKQTEIPGQSLNAGTKEKPTLPGSLARHEEAKSICCATEHTQHLPLPKPGTGTHGLPSRLALAPLPAGTAGNLSFPRPLVQVEQPHRFILFFP